MSSIPEHGKPTMAALAPWRLVHHVPLDNGILAMDTCRTGLAAPELESAVEASILLSGIGLEDYGLAAAYSIVVALGLLVGKMTPQEYY